MGSDFPKSISQFFADRGRDRAEATRKRYAKTLRRALAEASDDPSFAWIQSKSGLPWLRLAIEFPREQMLEEAKRVHDRFVSHRSGGKRGYLDGNRGWRALAIHGLGPDKTGDSHHYGFESDEVAPHNWTEIAKLCPVTTAFFRKVFPCGRYYRLRFSMMDPGGFIYPHVDRPNSYLGEVNFALNNPEECLFKMKGHGYVPLRAGKAYILDVSNLHAVANFSDKYRYHIIVHGQMIKHPKWPALIQESFRRAART